MDKEQTAIERLRMASEMSLKHYKTPLVVTTSGGKDSAVCVALAERAGIPFEAMHNHTTVDARRPSVLSARTSAAWRRRASNVR